MLIEKVKSNFEKYSELNILFLFDPKKEYSEAHPNDDYSKLKINKPAKINRLNAFLNDWLKDEDLSAEIENVFNELASDVDESIILKNYGIDGDYGFYTNSISFKIIEKIIEIIEYQPVTGSL